VISPTATAAAAAAEVHTAELLIELPTGTAPAHPAAHLRRVRTSDHRQLRPDAA